MKKRVFTRDFLTEELGLPYDGCYVIEDKLIDNDRWSIMHQLIFEHEGKFYRTNYSVGATENQPEAPWDYEDEVECWEVEKRLVQVEQWVEVEEELR